MTPRSRTQSGRWLFALATLAALAACRSSRPPAPPPPSSPTTPPVQVQVDVSATPPPEVTPPASDASASVEAGTDASVMTPEERLVRAFARGEIAVTDAVDPVRGVTVVHYLEAPPSGEGREDISSRRHCGTGLTQSADALRRELTAAVEQAEAMGGFQCSARDCLVTGMEYAPMWNVTFVQGDGGSLRIEAVVRASRSLMNQAWVARSEAYVNRSLAASRARPCGPR